MSEQVIGKTSQDRILWEDLAADINHRLIMNFRDISYVMRALYEGKASQKRVLIVLKEIGRVTQRDLTRRLRIQPSSASEVLAKLENARFIRRCVSEEDRRNVWVDLTEEGKRTAEEAENQRRARHAQMFSCLTQEEKSTLLHLLEKINQDWENRYVEVR